MQPNLLPENLVLVETSKGYIFEHSRENTNNLGFRTGQTHIRLYSHRSRLEA